MNKIPKHIQPLIDEVQRVQPVKAFIGYVIIGKYEIVYKEPITEESIKKINELFEQHYKKNHYKHIVGYSIEKNSLIIKT